jgi:O-antigen/teichoic acid export membrane protein
MRALLAKATRALRGNDRHDGNMLARSVTVNIAGRVGYLLVGFVAAIVLARLLGPSGRGLLGLMISANSLALVLTTVGVPLAIVYFASIRDADQGALLGNSLIQAVVLTAVLVPLAALFYNPLADAFGEGHGGRTWILVAALVPVTFLDWTTHGQIHGMLLFGRFSTMLVLSRVAYAVGIGLLVGAFDLGVAGGVLATAIGSLAMIAGSLKPILARGRPRIDIPLLRTTLHYGWRVQIGSVFQLTNGRLDVLVMQIFRPLSEVGYYVVAQTIAELVITLANAFQSSVMPLITSYEGDERAEQTSIDSIRHHGILAAAAVLANAVFGTLVIVVGYGSQFHPAVGPMLILLPGIWFLGMGIVIQGDLSGRGRPGLSSALAGMSAAMTIILDFALIPPLGMYGGAISSVVAYTTFGIASLIALGRVTGIPWNELAIPTRADFAGYWVVIRRASAAVRARPRS